MDAPRLLRPAKVEGQYGTWVQYASEDAAAAAAAAVAAGRGAGRSRRRVRHLERLKVERNEKKNERLQRKSLAKVGFAWQFVGGC